MGRAAAAVARAADEIAPEGPVLVAVGPGNNGGDGLYAAAIMAAHRPVVWRALRTANDDGFAAALGAGAREVDAVGAIGALADCALVVDAVVGLGSRPGLPPALTTFAEACEASGVPVLAVDLPSGLDSDSGALHPSFRADHTITLPRPRR